MRFSSATFSNGEWGFTARGNWVYDRISGPEHRLDLSFRALKGATAARLPHGIVGQSFDGQPRVGARDDYPAEGHFTTSAMAEGAIEGEAAMYEVAGPHATSFVFSRFDSLPAKPLSHSLPEIGPAAEASATDAPGPEPDSEATYLQPSRRLKEWNRAAPCPPPYPPTKAPMPPPQPPLEA